MRGQTSGKTACSCASHFSGAILLSSRADSLQLCKPGVNALGLMVC